MRDETGKRYERLTVVGWRERHAQGSRRRPDGTIKSVREGRWECLCDCGKTKFLRTPDLGRIKSCGCLYDERRRPPRPPKELRVRKTVMPRVDQTGQRFGKLTVLRWEPQHKLKKKSSGRECWIGAWECQCDCGEITFLSSTLLPRRKSCAACCRLDLTPGQRFGKLTVLREAGRNARGLRMWDVRCDCGAEKSVAGSKLSAGSTVSCGCSKTSPQSRETVLKRIQARAPLDQAARERHYAEIVEKFKQHGLKVRTSWEEFREIPNPYQTVLDFTCKENGHEFRAHKGSMLLAPYCRVCHQYKSKGELELREWVSALLPAGEVVSNARGVLPDRLELDLWVPSLKLGIEYNGLFWHSEKKQPDRRYHLKKREAMEALGGSLLQFQSDEWEQKREIVQSIIRNRLGLIGQKFQARKLFVKVLTNAQAELFLNENHLMGAMRARHVGLVTRSGEVVSLLSFKKKEDGIDIARFCNLRDTVVHGGLSRLLQHVIRQEGPEFIESWVDLRYGVGSSLAGLGFQRLRVTLGWRWSNGRETFNRRRCRANMDARKLSENEHAQELGWFRVFDAGQALYRIRLSR